MGEDDTLPLDELGTVERGLETVVGASWQGIPSGDGRPCQRVNCTNLIPDNKRAHAKYCSDKCKWLAYKERHGLA